MSFSRTQIAGVIAVCMLAITINAVWRVRVMGQQEKARREAEAAEAGAQDGGVEASSP